MNDTSPLAGNVSLWLSKIEMAYTRKNERFGRDARDGMFFYKGPYDQMYTGAIGGLQSRHFGQAAEGQGSSMAPPAFRMTLNKVAELVQVFGPELYFKNPNRKVTPRQQVMTTTDMLGSAMGLYPQYQELLQQLLMMSMQQNAQDNTLSLLIEQQLNATPAPLDLKTNSKQAIDECLIKGLGLLWTTVYTPPGSQTKVVGSFYDSCDNLLIDPDATSWKTAKWIARKWILPVWEAERKFKLEPGTVRPNMESSNRQAELSAMGLDGSIMRSGSKTCDMVLFYEVWSKTGLGSRLKGARDDFSTQWSEQVAGDYAYIVVCPGVDFPLNCPPTVLGLNGGNMEAAQKAFMWETPFFVDETDGGWPCCPLWFHTIPNEAWPASHISFAMGELKFMNWVASWLAGKVRTTCRDFIAAKKRLAAEFKQTLKSGEDLSLLEITEEYKSVRDAVEFLQHPQMNPDIFTVLSMIEQWFDQRTGLSELMYGQSRKQYRSAAEAEIKKEQASVRPDDMANQVEDWQSKVSAREAFASQWHLKGLDVVPFIGKPGAALWQLMVADRDPSTILYDFQYRVEAGSIRKPNQSRDAENAAALMQQVLPLAVQMFSLTMDIGPVNKILTVWAKSMGIDPSLVQMTPQMLMPPPVAGPGGAPQPGGPAQAAPALAA